MNHQDLSSVRPLSSRDVEALRAATLGNMNWCGERFSREEVLADPAIAHYTVFEPERGDFGFIMVDPSGVVGVAWAQFLGVENPGYGFVAADVPEASLWVAPERRGDTDRSFHGSAAGSHQQRPRRSIRPSGQVPTSRVPEHTITGAPVSSTVWLEPLRERNRSVTSMRLYPHDS